MFPAFFQATVGQRFVLWGGLLLLVWSLYVAVDLIHAQKLAGFLAEISQAAAAGAVEKVKELHVALDYHAAGNGRNKLLLSLLLMFLVAEIAWLEFRWLVRPVIGLSREVELNAGNARFATAIAMRRDEAGVLARAILAHHEKAARRAEASAGEVATLSTQLREREYLQQATMAFRKEISSVVVSLRGHGERMTEASARLSGASAELGDSTRETSDSIRQSSEKVSAAADLIRNFASTIHMLSSEMEGVSGASAQSRGAVEDARGDTRELAEAVTLIEQMVVLISDVATRTNLLALNATIEAARAGEHGRGFAVVASEVKQLAQQTAQATGDAGQRLETVKAVARRIDERMTTISDAVGTMDQNVQTIASAIRAEGSTSLAVSDDARAIADAVRGEAERVARIRALAEQTDGAASAVAETARDLAGKADDLNRAFDQYVATTAERAA
ncbi:MAG: methyl-accepting chemotaxis protein [Beijerinckiaceae bacterium]